MKNLLFLSPVVLLIIIFSSCDEKIQEFSFEGKGIFTDLVNLEDSIDQNINIALFQTGNAIKELARNNEDDFRSKLLNKLTENENEPIAISKVFDENLVDKINKKINYRSLGQNISSLDELSKSMNYMDVSYFPALSICNSLNQGKEFSKNKLIIAIAAEVEQEGMIPGWEIEGNNIKEILINEESVNSTNPLILVQNHSNTPIIAKASGKNIWGKDNVENVSNLKISSSGIKIVWDDYQIKSGYRYDKSKSELKFALAIYKPTPPYWDIPWKNKLRVNYGIEAEKLELIKRIKKKDVNSSKIFTDDKTFVENHPMTVYTAEQAKYYVTVYEHDWYASRKSVQSCISNQFQNKVRMKYSHEWYYVDYCDFSAAGSWVGARFTVENNKCRLTLKRTQ